MSSFKNIVLKTILTYGLSSREVFVEKVSAVLERYQNDEEKIKELGDYLYAALSDYKKNLTDRDNVASGVEQGNEQLNTNIAELTRAIEELRKEIKAMK
jgi:chaperonin cofactor prefoldin